MPKGRTVTVLTGPGHRGAKHIAKKALREVRQLRKLEDVTFLDTADSAAVTASWAVLGSDYLNIAQGDAESTRTGDRVNLRSIHLRGTITPSATQAAAKLARVVMYYIDKSSTLPTLPDPMQENDVLSFSDLNVKFGRSIRLLYDKTFSLSPTFDASVTIGASKIIVFQKHIKMNKNLVYDGAAASVPLNGRLVIQILGLDATTPPVVATNVRIRFSG